MKFIEVDIKGPIKPVGCDISFFFGYDISGLVLLLETVTCYYDRLKNENGEYYSGWQLDNLREAVMEEMICAISLLRFV